MPAVSNVDVPITGGWRGLQSRGAKGPCSQCGLPADEKASNGKKYCLTCWDEWDKKALQAKARLKGEGKKVLAIEKAPEVKATAVSAKVVQVGVQKVPACTYRIALDNSAVHEMEWDSTRQLFHYVVQLGFMEEESFQILVNGDSEKVLYPEWPHGSFHSGDAMRGPDADHRGKQWTIGRHKLDKAEEGASYEVRLRIKADGSARHIDWVKLEEAAPATEAANVCEEAVRLYSERLAKLEGDEASDDETAEPSQSGSGSSDAEELSAETRLELERDLATCCVPEAVDAQVDSDGEEVCLCSECGLPLGDFGYTATEGEKLIHGECMAKKVIDDMRKEDEERMQKDVDLKKKRRAEYDIGWKVERIPRSLCLAKKLQCCTKVPQGMCCLVLDKESKMVRIAPTLEPAASVNLPYLAMALQVRLKEGKEPWFSLDPVDGDDTMQVKRFEPSWLAGTRLGEAMFQADYHLKELSMGEYEQPVLGMKSCHDLLEIDGLDKEWNAREWFVIKKAQVQVSSDDVLLPFVQMGVEAREQSRGSDGLEDVLITRPDHPMVKYAELFTENFDLIAERKSAIFHLRELAKATVMAKYLIDAQVSLDDCWFNSAEEVIPSPMEIPQLWNERSYSKVHVTNGHVRDMDMGIAAKTHGIYGGVQLGVPGVPAPPGVVAVPGVPAIVAAPAPTRMAARLAPSVSGVSTMGRLVAAGPAGLTIRPTPKGVDLNLGQFDLSEAVEASSEVLEGSWTGAFQCSDASLVIGGAFWDSLEASEGALKDEDKRLLKAVFNRSLSDRRQEGDLFVPPDTSASHVRRLRELVQREETLQQDRIQHFSSTAFTIDNVGPLFPRSWRSSIDLARGQSATSSSLNPRPDFKAEAAALQDILNSSSPAFDKSTEDGLRFRVYKVGSLEVRTTQESGKLETIAAVFSTSATPQASEQGKQGRIVMDTDKVVKVTEYVERAGKCGQCRYYAVLQTEGGGAVVTEQLEDGQVTFEVSPANLEDRNSLAKVLRSTNSRAAQLTVGDMRKHAEAAAVCGATPSQCKQYTWSVSSSGGAVARTVTPKKEAWVSATRA